MYWQKLLSDKNMVPLIMVKFQGTGKTAASERNDYGNQCIFFSYEQIKTILQQKTFVCPIRQCALVLTGIYLIMTVQMKL